MNIKPSLIIKNDGDNVIANICVGGQSIASSKVSEDLHFAINSVLCYPYSALQVKNVLVSIDFTKKFSLDMDFSNILYIKILPAVTSQVNAHMFSNNDINATDKAINFTILYDFHEGFVNIDALFELIEQTKAGYIALNSPFSITEFSIEVFNSLKARGLKDVWLVVSDAHKGLTKAIRESFVGCA